MAELPQKIAFHLETRQETLRMARKLVASAARVAGANSLTASEIEVAIGEALSNAHLHAYHGGVGPIEIEVVIEGPQFAVTIHDHGSPVTPPVVPTDRPMTGQTGGHGLYLIAQLMDAVIVEQFDAEGRGISIRMARQLE